MSAIPASSRTVLFAQFALFAALLVQWALSATSVLTTPLVLLPTIAHVTKDSSMLELLCALPVPPSAKPAHLPLLALHASKTETELFPMASASAELVSIRS